MRSLWVVINKCFCHHWQYLTILLSILLASLILFWEPFYGCRLKLFPSFLKKIFSKWKYFIWSGRGITSVYESAAILSFQNHNNKTGQWQFSGKWGLKTKCLILHLVVISFPLILLHLCPLAWLRLQVLISVYRHCLEPWLGRIWQKRDCDEKALVKGNISIFLPALCLIPANHLSASRCKRKAILQIYKLM